LSWLRNKHLWIAVSLVSLAVALELIRRLLLQIQYLVIGYGLSDVSMPTLYFLDPMYDPMFYIKNLLWLENNVILTMLALGTLPLLWRQSGFAYYCTLLFSVIFLMTNTLSNAAIRYAYYLQPFLILSASSVAFGIVDHLVSMIPRGLFHHSRLLKHMVTVGLFVLVTVSSSMFMKFYRISGFAYPSGVHTRTDVHYIDYRGTAQYEKSHYQDGDLIIALVSDALTYYAGIESHYFVQAYTMRQVFYDPSENSPRYLERIVGNPLVRDFDELKEILSNYRRIWVIAVPESIFIRMAGPEIRKFLQPESKVVYEGYNARVYLLQM
jgi:hypothetical protein